MRIITFNCNGIRSAAGKGLFQWLPRQDADVVCLQETKAQEHQLQDVCFQPTGYHCRYYDAERKGYSGVAIYSRRKPDRVITGFGIPEFDREAPRGPNGRRRSTASSKRSCRTSGNSAAATATTCCAGTSISRTARST